MIGYIGRTGMKRTHRQHVLQPILWDRQYWTQYNNGMRGLWCGESDYYGERMSDYRQHRYMIRNSTRLYRRYSVLYGQVAACYFILSWRFLWMRMLLSDEERTSIVQSRLSRGTAV
jgi:hypothetical protein